MGWNVKVSGLDEAFAGAEAQIAAAMTGAMADSAASLKEELRQQVRAAGLGEKLAKTWQGKVYPSGAHSLDPSAFVWSKAPKVIDAYDSGATITPRNGRKFLAIPTLDVPKKRQGNRLTPEEVENRYGRRLIFIDPADKGFSTPSMRRPGVAYLVMKGLVVRRASSRFRNASPRELEKARRGLKDISSVIMFVLVPAVRVRKRLDIAAAVTAAVGRFDQTLAANWR